MTFFSQLQHKYSYTKTENDDHCVDAATFLAATRESLAVLDKLGFAFRLVKSDVLGNVSKLQSTHDQDPVRFATFESMLMYDVEMGASDNGNSATVALLWLKRALEFFCAFTSLMVAEYRSETLGESLFPVVHRAYEQSLSRHHNWFMRGTFYVVAHAMPSRRHFFKSLANGQESMDDRVVNDMENFVNMLSPNLVSINQTLTDLGQPD
jgi:hypothetical protein